MSPAAQQPWRHRRACALAETREPEPVRIEYNSKGKVCTAIDPVGRETRYTYGTDNVPDADCVSGDGIVDGTGTSCFARLFAIVLTCAHT